MLRTIVALALAVGPGFAQLTRGFISGMVQDPSGAAVTGARVTATERSTGFRHSTVTNDAGVYKLVALEPGIYTVEFIKPGFEMGRIEQVEVGTAKEVVLNHSMVVAATSSSITVSTAVAGVELTKASPVIDRRFSQRVLESMPLSAMREVRDLALLTPAVVALPQGNISAAGQRGAVNNLLFDGIEGRDPQWAYPIVRVTPELASEVHVQANPYSAEFGRHNGAQISVVTRGGTNVVHGEVWDYYRGNRTSATTLANKRAGVDLPRFSDHQAGFNLAGPVRKDRTFFFVYLQAQPYREGASATGLSPVTIPTSAGYAALARAPLGEGQSAASRAAMFDALSFLPEIHAQVRRYDSSGARPVNGVLVDFGTTTITQARPSDRYTLFGRFDHQISSAGSLSARATVTDYYAPIVRNWAFSNNAFGSRFASFEDVRTHFHSITHTHVFTPALINEARLSFSRHDVVVAAPPDRGTRAQITNLFAIGPAGASPFIRPNNIYQFQDVATLIRGRQSMRLGADVVSVRDAVSSTRQNAYTFNNIVDYMNNLASTATFVLNAASIPLRSLRHSYFVQDDIKFTPMLTVNFGLRYQMNGLPAGLLAAATPEIAAAGVPVSPRRDVNDVAPRLGFAWNPTARSGWTRTLLGGDQTVFRAGWGMSYGIAFEQDAVTYLALANNYPYNSLAVWNSPDTQNLYPTAPHTVSTHTAFNPMASFTNYDPAIENPVLYFYSFSVQRQLGRQHVLEIGYTGNRAQHLYRTTERNPAVLTGEQAALVIATRDPNRIPSADARRLMRGWGIRTVQETTASSNYNAAYMKLDRRFARGFEFGLNYTWSASLGDGDGAAERPNNPANYRQEYGRTDLDRPHRFVVHYAWVMSGHAILRNWRIAGHSQWQSGQPFTIRTGVDSNGDGCCPSAVSVGDRPDYNPPGLLQLDPVSRNWRTFTTPVDGRGVFITPLNASGLPLVNSMPFGGNLGRNTFNGPGLALWNVSIMRPFAISERWRLELRADMINMLNHRNFGPPISVMNSPRFGMNDSDPGERQITLGAKIRF